MKIMFITNILTPYRISFYDELNSLLKSENVSNDLRVIAMTSHLPLRPWKYSELQREYTVLLANKVLIRNGTDYIFNWGLRKTIRDFSPDLVVIAGSWTYSSSILVTLMKKKYISNECRLFFWNETHDNAAPEFVAHNLTNGLIRKLKQMIFKRFDGFCVPGILAKESVKKFTRCSNFIELHNAVDSNFYFNANEMREQKNLLREEYRISENRTVILIVARLIKLKGIDKLISNIDGQLFDYSNLTFVIAGEGEERNTIEELAKQNCIDVRLLGYQNQVSIRKLLATADFFCLPSLSDANPLTVIEALWAGLPLIVSKYTGNYPELVQDGENGFIFDPLDSESVNNTMIKAIESNDGWRKTAQSICLKIANDGYSLNGIVSSFYKDVIEVCKNDKCVNN
jgi:glycosyltransferase involved in cell wall biosynthesis